VVGGVVIQGLSRASGVILKNIGKLFQQSLAAARVAQTTSNIAASAARGIGTLSKYLEEVIAKLVGAGVRSGDAIAARLEELVGGVAELVSKCSKTCRNNVDQVLLKVKTGVNGAVQFVGKTVDDALLNVKKFLQKGSDPSKAHFNQCRLQHALKLLGTGIALTTTLAIENVLEDIAGKAQQLTLGWIHKLYTNEVEVDPETIDSPSSSPRNLSRGATARTQATPTPNPVACWRGSHLKTMQAEYAKAGVTDFAEVEAFIGMKAFDTSKTDYDSLVNDFDSLKTARLLPNYGLFVRPAKGRQKREIVMYCIKSPSNNFCKGKPNVIELGHDGYWRLPDVKKSTDSATGKVSYEARSRLAKYYVTNHGEVHPVFLKTGKEIHHLVADNVWKRVPMLRQAMQRCPGLHMDVGANLIEMAKEEATIAAVDGKPATGGQKFELDANGNKTLKVAKVGVNFSKVVHSGQHPQFDNFMIAKVQAAANIATGGVRNDDYWKDNTKCNEIKTILDAVQTQTRHLLTTGTAHPTSLTDDITRFADPIGIRGYFKLRNTQ
jgi:hypothetical protein